MSRPPKTKAIEIEQQKRTHREPSHPFRIWIKDLTTIYRVFLWPPFWIFNTRGGLLVRSLEPNFISLELANSRRIRSLTENNEVTRDETSHWLSHVSATWENGNKKLKRERKSKLQVSWRDFKALQHGRPKASILTTLTRDIQCEKFTEDESVSHEPCDSMYPNTVNYSYAYFTKLSEDSKNSNCTTPDTKNH